MRVGHPQQAEQGALLLLGQPGGCGAVALRGVPLELDRFLGRLLGAL